MYKRQGRTGNVVLTDQDDIIVNKINVGTGVTIESNGQATFVGVVTFGSGSTTIDNNVVNVGTALTLGHTQGLQFHTQNLHSAGFEINQINASGIITASSLDVGGNAFIGGVLTYEDVTSIDSVGIITAQKDIHVGAGVSAVGVGTFGTVKVGTGATIETNGQATFSGISTFSKSIQIPDGGPGVNQGHIRLGDGADLKIFHNGNNSYIQDTGIGGLRLNSNNLEIKNAADNERLARFIEDGAVELYHNNIKRLETSSVGVSIPQDLDVDGHTNLDNVSIAGFTTITQDLDVDGLSLIHI